MHKIDEQLVACADFFQLTAQFVLLNTVIIIVFKQQNGLPAHTHFIQRPQGLSLGQLRDTHSVYTQVIEEHLLDAAQGNHQLDLILQHPQSYGTYWKLFFAFLAGAAIAPMGFSGSIADALIAGGLSFAVQGVQLLGQADLLFVGVMEYVVTDY